MMRLGLTYPLAVVCLLLSVPTLTSATKELQHPDVALALRQPVLDLFVGTRESWDGSSVDAAAVFFAPEM